MRYIEVLLRVAWYCIELYGIAYYCLVLHGIVLYCTILHGIVQQGLLFGIAWSCVVIVWNCTSKAIDRCFEQALVSEHRQLIPNLVWHVAVLQYTDTNTYINTDI